MSIRLFYDSAGYRLKDLRKLKTNLVKVISGEGKITGDLNVILTNDRELIRINRTFLNHDYFTDVISFDYSEGDTVNGEIYISIDTVKVNAYNYNVSFRDELIRVMIHGILHLTGQNDKTAKERRAMKVKEDHYLRLISKEMDGNEV